MRKKDKKTKKKLSNKKKIFICFILVILIISSYFVYTNFIKNDSTTAPKVVDEIKEFDYVVNENDTKLFKKIFGELKTILSKKEIDKKAYAETISKLFVVDFFNLDNKTSKNDVGGAQFVYTSYRTDFIDYARDGMYKQVNNSIDKKTGQVLPEVTSVEVKKTETVDASEIFDLDDFDSEDKKEAYQVELSWKYKNGNGFQDSAKLIVVVDGKKLSIAKMEEE